MVERTDRDHNTDRFLAGDSQPVRIDDGAIPIGMTSPCSFLSTSTQIRMPSIARVTSTCESGQGFTTLPCGFHGKLCMPLRHDGRGTIEYRNAFRQRQPSHPGSRYKPYAVASATSTCRRVTRLHVGNNTAVIGCRDRLDAGLFRCAGYHQGKVLRPWVLCLRLDRGGYLTELSSSAIGFHDSQWE